MMSRRAPCNHKDPCKSGAGDPKQVAGVQLEAPESHGMWEVFAS